MHEEQWTDLPSLMVIRIKDWIVGQYNGGILWSQSGLDLGGVGGGGRDVRDLSGWCGVCVGVEAGTARVFLVSVPASVPEVG